MTKNRILFALGASLLGLFTSVARAEEPRTVVWLTADRAPSDAVRLEAEAAGYRLVVADVPAGPDGGSRLASARALGRVLGGDFTVLVEMQGTPTVFVIAADGTIAHAPLSDARFSQRALALVAMSLVEDLADGPTAPPAYTETPEEAQPAQATPAPAEPEAPAADVSTQPLPAHEQTTTVIGTAEEPPAAAGEPVMPPTVVVIDTPPGSEVTVDVHPAVTEERMLAVGADILPFVGTSTFTRGQATRRLSFNLFIGFDGGLHGFELGTIANIHRRDVRGVQIAGMLNAAGGELHGVQLSGFMNYAGADSTGVQLGQVNFARRRLHGAQLGELNISGDLEGAQLGMLNIARGDTSGAQVGMVNVTTGNVHGVQVGLVNVSRDADFAFGLINIVRDGRTHLELLGNDGGFMFAGVKHGGRHFHSIYSLGVNAFRDDPMFAVGLGLGARATPGERVFLDFDLVGHCLVDRETDDGNGNVETMSSARVLVGVHLMQRLSLVAGASYDVLVTPRDRTNGFGHIDAEVLHESTAGTDDVRVLGWPSLMLGLQVL